MPAVRVAAAAYPFGRHLTWDSYEAHLSAFVQATNAQILVLPEYASLELVGLLPSHLWNDIHAQRPALQAYLPRFLALHARLARERGAYLLAGSFPVEVAAGRFVNRAYFFAPSGQHAHQDKLMMTRFEAEEWHIESGEGLSVVDTAHGKVGINICYDAEFPDFARAQAAAGMDLLLLPSFTSAPSGYQRVRIGGMARALENQLYTVHAPLLAQADWTYTVESAVGTPGIYAPPDTGLPDSGVMACGAVDTPGWLECTLEFSLLREVRRSGQVLNARDQAAAKQRGQNKVRHLKLTTGVL